MKASVDVENIFSPRLTMEIEHGKQVVKFVISNFGVNAFKGFDVFYYINGYWSSLPELQQLEIFNIYRDISQGFDILNKNMLSDLLMRKTTELMQHHKPEHVSNWVTMNSDIVVPQDVSAEYIPNIDKNISRDRTYTRADYWDLITLSLSMRAMIPIWGNYIHFIRGEVGNQYKEYYAFLLMNDTPLMKSTAVQKLLLYIESNVGKDKNNPNIQTKNFISSEDFNHWLLALVCVRRLCVGDIRGVDQRGNLASLVYMFVRHKIQFTDNDFSNKVKPKSNDEYSPEGDNKISNLERYKIKSDISTGQIVELEYSVSDIYEVAPRLTSQLDFDQLTKSLATSHVLNEQRILDPQMTLLRWVFKPVIVPRGLMYLPKPTIVKALGALEAVLWARGHKYLALLSTAYVLLEPDAVRISSVNSKMRVPSELTEELDRIFPYKRKKNTRNGDEYVNLVAESIDQLANDLSMFTWRATASDEMLQEVFGVTSRRIPIRPDIKTDLTKLIIEIGKRTWL